MKAIQSLVVSAALAIGMATPALAAQSDPEVLIYRFPLVLDDLFAATVFGCTNFSGATENIRMVTRSANGALATNQVFSIAHLATISVSTHSPMAYFAQPMNTGVLSQGTTAIAATSINVICTAVSIDVEAKAPVGVALRGIRFNPAPGSQE